MATFSSPTTILSLWKARAGTAGSLIGFTSDLPPRAGAWAQQQLQQMQAGGVDTFTVDEFFLNNTGGALSAGDWVSRDLSPIQVDDGSLALWLDRDTFPYPMEFLYRRMKQAPASADAQGVVGVLMEAVADGAVGKVRRRGLIIPEVHGVTPTLSVSGSSDTVYGLQISGTAGTAEVAGATTERCIGYLLVSLGTADDDVVEVSCL